MHAEYNCLKGKWPLTESKLYVCATDCFYNWKLLKRLETKVSLLNCVVVHLMSLSKWKIVTQYLTPHVLSEPCYHVRRYAFNINSYVLMASQSLPQVAQMAAAAPPPVASKNPAIASTRQYFRSVQILLCTIAYAVTAKHHRGEPTF